MKHIKPNFKYLATLLFFMGTIVTPLVSVNTASADTLGSIAEYTVASGANPYGIVEGTDGNLWFTEQTSNKISKMTKSGILTRYSLPSGSSTPAHIELGPNGNPWFGMAGVSKYGQIDYSGNITTYNLPSGQGNGATGGA